MVGVKIWEFVARFFLPYATSDNFGEPEKVSGFVLILLWVLRFSTGWAIHVNHGFKTTGHSKYSQHYKGNAIDFYFVTDVPFYKQIERVEKLLMSWQFFDFVGLGIYPDWNRPGFHIDTRGFKARWGYVNKQVGDKIKAVMVGYEIAKQRAKKMMEEKNV